MEELQKQRRTRRDKKRDVKPTLDIDFCDCIARISYICNIPIKDVSERLCMEAWLTQDIMDQIKKFIRRNLMWEDRIMFMGDASRKPYSCKDGILTKKRITIRFNQEFHSKLAELAYALDTTVSSATGFLLRFAVNDGELVHQFIARNIHHQLDPVRSRQLHEILQYINRGKPEEQRITLAMAVGQILGHVAVSGENFKKTLINWIDQHTK